MVTSPHLLLVDMPKGVTVLSHQIYYIHHLSFLICLGMGLIIYLMIIIFLFKYKKTAHKKPRDVHSKLWVEVIWLAVPMALLIIMAVPATKTLINMNDTSKAVINIKITGHQWKWQYEYLDYGIQFFSNLSTPHQQIAGKETKNNLYLREVDRPLVVPIQKKIRFLVTSHDVIHSWWVPDLGIKRDGIPGFIYEAWAYIYKPGIYRGQCAELCGINHAYMPIVIEAKSAFEFEQWVKENQLKKVIEPIASTLSFDQLMSIGKKVYESQCSACHRPDGSGMGESVPALKGSKVSIGPLGRHIDIILNGEPGTAMSDFGPQLSDEQIAAVITFERNNWGNGDRLKYGTQAGGTTQPNVIAQARKFQEAGR